MKERTRLRRQEKKIVGAHANKSDVQTICSKFHTPLHLSLRKKQELEDGEQRNNTIYGQENKRGKSHLK